MGEKKKEEKTKGFLEKLFKPKGGCCDVKFVPIKEDEQKNPTQEKK
ncbi:MAG: hypothetical protein PHT62_07000 [Desulfotomaculaceae bacterium]|nr:hypothetical protein [Desulfotomaculaceae bacterium]